MTKPTHSSHLSQPSLWVRVMRRQRILKHHTLPCRREAPQDALQTACTHLDIPRPLWLEKNHRDWEAFGQTRFMKDAFFEQVDFDHLEIQLLEPDEPDAAR